MKKRLFLAVIVLSWIPCVFAQQPLSVYPANWFTGMKRPQLQLMIHATGIGNFQAALEHAYPGVSLKSVQRVKNKNYLFINLQIMPEARPETVDIVLQNGKSVEKIRYPLYAKKAGNGTRYAAGIRSSDFVYLIMPDRFSNGDPSNDRFAGLRDTVCNRNNPLARHGGDLQGVINHLDYIRDLGVTAIWLCPVIENDMPPEKEPSGSLSGYHGYWFTNHYRIDPRFGGDSAYKRFVAAVHAKGLKVIQDAVYNHIGEAHWWMSDLPTADWINQWPQYQNTNHREQAMFDLHGSAKDKEIMEAGWFVPHLPDLNLKNPLLATFMIQNAIWMTETYELDGWRVDTYKYCYEPFLNDLNNALAAEFPSLTSFGEAWVNTVPAAAYFCRNNMNIPFKHNLQGVTDFPLCFAMLDAIGKKSGWDDGVNRIYATLALDLLYKNPLYNCIFLDNHDMDRFYSVAGEDYAGFEIGMGLLLTMRGIPQLYYGTEILMKNFKNPSDAQVREDFPGGFPGDPVNKFQSSGRTELENLAHDYIAKLAGFRKTAPALGNGALMQYVPSNGLYVYFR
ncbi:MAG TPA: glycoside hydrolase family 13 protein, partial [Puia sp.]|nr:glycoside hydrolase family 13 protein [Puia sp.]